MEGGWEAPTPVHPTLGPSQPPLKAKALLNWTNRKPGRLVFDRLKSVKVKTFKSLLADVLSRVQCLPGAQSRAWTGPDNLTDREKQVFPPAASVKIIAHQVKWKLIWRDRPCCQISFRECSLKGPVQLGLNYSNFHQVGGENLKIFSLGHFFYKPYYFINL